MYLNYRAQRGSALVIAVFVIVVMLALALSMARLLSSSSETVVYEVQGNRSLFAAQSALELAELFPLNSSTTGCGAVSAEHTFADAGLQGCSATVSCRAYTATSPAAVPLFQLSSTANCVAGGFLTRRTVQIEVR